MFHVLREFHSDASGADARANVLDTLAAVLPPSRRDALAGLLTDDDVSTLKYLVDKGLGANTLRAMTSDLAYLAAWCQVSTGETLPWPAPQPLLLKFIAQHLYDADASEADNRHGMPPDVRDRLKAEGVLRQTGPHKAATVRRRLALWSTLHRWRGLIGAFADPHVKTALRSAMRAVNVPQTRKSSRALTRDIVDRLVATCRVNTLAGLRDRAVLLVAFASGGRRRSEVAGLRISQITKEPATLEDPNDPHSKRLVCYSVNLGRTKNEHGSQPPVMIVGRAADALASWLQAARITSGPVFRKIDRWGKLGADHLTPEAVNGIVKTRCRLAKLDPKLYSAHGLRSGYMTEAARKRVPIVEAMQQSRHKSVQQASVYYDEANRSETAASRLAG